MLTFPGREPIRERRKAPVPSKSVEELDRLVLAAERLVEPNVPCTVRGKRPSTITIRQDQPVESR